MKRIGFSLMLACALELSLEAQTHSQGGPPNTNAPGATVAPTIAARSLNSRTWVRIISQTNAAGQVSTVTNKAYKELASGLCYEKEGQLADAVEQIDIVPDGASATQSQHKVHFAANANTPGGAVIMKSRDGKTFATRVYGLSYWDTVSGTNILLAPLQDCQGIVVSNRVVYTNAFQGLNADLEYVFTKAGLEQNVILREQLPAPESVGTGLASASTRLQVLTEFISSPVPNTSKTQVISGIPESTLIDFGAMKIGMGKAFFVPGQNGKKAIDLGRVSKHWKQLEDGRKFLFEEVPFKTISNAVRNLPVHASAGAMGTAVKHLAALEPLLPLDIVSNASPMTMQLAKSMPDQPGVVLDYFQFNASPGTNIYDGTLFQSDTTYYISGFTYVTNPIFEGGTVLKFESSYGDPFLVNDGDKHCQFNGSAYRPVVFTSSDDDSVGDSIYDSSGNPSTQGLYAWYICEVGGEPRSTDLAVADLRFSYAGAAYVDFNDTSHIVSDCQFVKCAVSLWLGDTSLRLLNDLFDACGAVVVPDSSFALDAENITAHSIGNFVEWGSGSGGITNSILTACDTSIYDFTIDSTCVVQPSGASIYQTKGDGKYYFAAGFNHGTGTTNINPSLLAELKSKTTYPPVVYSNTTISANTTLGIAAPRDAGTPGPDIGFHYDPLDYVFGGTTVNGNLTFANGVAAGWFNDGSGYGILMGNTMNANFQGTAASPVWWVRVNTVQESGGNTVWPGTWAVGGLVGADWQYNEDVSQSPLANLVFTHCSILGAGDGGAINHFRDDWGYLIVNAEHSEFHGGYCGGYVLSLNFTNCLVDRTVIAQVEGWPGNVFIFTNCTWHGGQLGLSPVNTEIPIHVRDTAFDGTYVCPTDYGLDLDWANYDYNAFGNGAQPPPIGGASNVLITNGFNWQISIFGNYYLPTDSPLIAAGDVPAYIINLSDFTTQTNQTPEGNSIVDIGYHYLESPTITNQGYITDGLVACWMMTDGAAESVSNGPSLQLVGLPSGGSNYLTLNGTSQYGDAGSNALTNLDDSSMTICAWINTRLTNLQGIVTKDYWTNRGDYGGWCFSIENNQMSWNLEDSATNNPVKDNGLGIVPLGQWVFVAVTWFYSNSSDYEACFYINGQLNSTYSSAGNPPLMEQLSGPAHLFVGNVQDTLNLSNYPFEGLIRDVGIYKSVLSAADILTNFFNTEPTMNVPNPDLLYFKMTETNQTNVPLGLSNSATFGAHANAIVWNTNSGSSPQLPEWTNNPGGFPSAIHFHGETVTLTTNVTTNGTTNVITNITPQTQITVTNSTLFNFTTNPFTINLWLRPYSGGYYFMGNDNYTTNGWYLAENAGNSDTEISFGGETNNADRSISTINGPPNWPSGPQNWTDAWSMVTITYDGINTPLIYVNAQVYATDYSFKSPVSSTNYLMFGLGTSNSNGLSDLDGDMWLPQIWNTNLSSVDVANLYFNQKSGKPWP